MRFDQFENGKWREINDTSRKVYWITKVSQGKYTTSYGPDMNKSVVLHNKKDQTTHTSFLAACQLAVNHSKSGGRAQ